MGRIEGIRVANPTDIPYIQAKIEIRREAQHQRHKLWTDGKAARRVHQFDPEFTARMYSEHRKLSKTNQKIITQLRTQHIALNFHLHSNYSHSKKNKPLTPNCTQCQSNTPETVEHFLFHCDSYIVLRDHMYQELKEVDEKLDSQHISLQTVLFPKNNISFECRIKILETVAKFVKNTNRLKFH